MYVGNINEPEMKGRWFFITVQISRRFLLLKELQIDPLQEFA